MKKSAVYLALATSLTCTTALAVEPVVHSTRTLGSGGGGTTYAHWSAAANYNPGLLGTATGKNSKDDAYFILNLYGRIADTKDDGDSIDSLEDFTDDVDAFEGLDNLDLLESDITNLQDTINASNNLINGLEDIDGAGAQSTIGLNMGFGFAFESFSLGFNAMAKVDFGGTANIDENDVDLLRRYTSLGQVLLDDVRPLYDAAQDLEERYLALEEEAERLRNSGSATQEDIDAAEQAAAEAEALFQDAEDLAEDAKNTEAGITTEFGDIFDTETQTFNFDEDDLESDARFAAIGWAEVGVTIGSKWELDNDKQLSVGATLKSVRLEFFDYQTSTSDFDEDDIDGDEYRSSKDFMTADIGAVLSMDAMDQWRIGVTVKNIVGEDISSRRDTLKDGQEPLFFEVEPQVRVGTSYNGGWYRLAADLDLTESKGPMFADGTEFFKGSQYGSLGAVINAWEFAELRAGYRHNFASDDSRNETEDSDGVITLGAGLYLWAVQFDLALQASPDLDDVGGGFQAMITF